MKLINNRIYLDYNATAPLAKSVTDWFASGALPFGNPSSIHSSGKLSKRLINETTDYLKRTFNLPYFEIFYHSGATEAINDVIKGFCFYSLAKKENFHVVAFATDHSCVVNQKEHIELLGGKFHTMNVDRNGMYDLNSVIEYIKKLDGDVLLNFTHVNNETGVIWPIADATKIKNETNCFVHVDAVQLIGKTDSSLHLDSEIDFYTFSGHKFGAMKGVGFSFAKERLIHWCALIRGGGQQAGMRSGTENVHGIYSLKLALVELLANFKPQELKDARDFVENSLTQNFKERITITAADADFRNLNTIYLVVHGAKTDILITAFDMAQIDLSSGSACSSGAVKPSRVLLAMGYSEEEAKSSIRISFPYSFSMEEAQTLSPKLNSILSRFLK
ncbi:cysteine desulfurase family protein [Bacteriovorax sp. Seq25_V]|uniref:cysteine desulfurase family protein n=1 Tax=Bacteriovorax sp. Seq25_V TaxID=1201288 RepID=UPI000389EE87|nr:aminotransferase class V-fold PLP-dependent enzyme [Bacteriovorax sp. Seq25_V]EQC46270.1 aminotransferase, class V [Bacteriovorax sp. Seq25_V]